MFSPGTSEQAQNLNVFVIFFFFLKFTFALHTHSLCVVIKRQIFAI